MKADAKKTGFHLAASPHVKIHERAMAKYRQMSQKERLASLVRAGVFKEDGTLASRFRCLAESDEV